jgi:hypothetical protein
MEDTKELEELFPVGCIVQTSVMEKLPQFHWKPVCMMVLPYKPHKENSRISEEELPRYQFTDPTKIPKVQILPADEVPQHTFGAELYQNRSHKPSFYKRVSSPDTLTDGNW